MSHSRSRRTIECWCCGRTQANRGRGLCQACHKRWRRRGFTGPGPGPSPRGRAWDYADIITRLSAKEAARVIGVTTRTIHRWRLVVGPRSTATPEWDGAPGYEVRRAFLEEFGGAA